MTEVDSEEEDDTPLQHKRAFGAGVKRKRIIFVPEAAPPAPVDQQPATRTPDISVGDAYLSIVLPKRRTRTDKQDLIAPGNPHVLEEAQTSGETVADDTLSLCAVCNLPFQLGPINAAPHEASLAHQVCLTHSHPPSALDRRRKGMTFLNAYGWDPDDRRGLGASGEGRLYPIQPRVREDNRGVGAVLRPKAEVVKAKKLHAGEVRRLEDEKRRKGRRMERLFHADDQVNRYLGLGI